MKADAWVDGSFKVCNKHAIYGAGAVTIIKGLDSPLEQKYADDEVNMARLHNVAGEILAALLAVGTCKRFKIEELVIHYDYAGIENWANGSWKANNDSAKLYQEFMNDARKTIDISFVKVKAHTGDEYNERADKLAKEAIREYYLKLLESETQREMPDIE